MSLVAHPSKLNGDISRNSIFNDGVVLEGHNGPALSAKFSRDGQNIVSAGMDRSILLWHLSSSIDNDNPNYGEITGHKGAVTSIEWILLDRLFSTSADSTIGFWDVETGQRLRKGIGHSLAVNSSSASSEIAISVGDDGTLRQWDERVKGEVKKIATPYPLLSCALSNDGKIAFVSGIDPAVRAYSLTTGNVMWECQGLSDPVTGLSLSSDQSTLVIRLSNASIHTVNAKLNVLQGASRLGPSYDGLRASLEPHLWRAAFSNDNVYLCLGSSDGSTLIWSTATKRIVSRLEGHKGAVVDVTFHPSEKILMTTSTAGQLIVREFE